jgi:hypothetical protein
MCYVYVDPKIDGDIKAVKKALEQMQRNIKNGKYLTPELNRVWNKIKQDAVSMCPKDTGSLAGSIRVVNSEAVDGLNPTNKSITVFDRAIVAGDSMKINPKTNGAVDYAQFVHDGYMRQDGKLYIGVPFLTYALALNEVALENAVDRALQKLGNEFSGSSGQGGSICLGLMAGTLLAGDLMQAMNKAPHKKQPKRAEKSPNKEDEY